MSHCNNTRFYPFAAMIDFSVVDIEDVFRAFIIAAEELLTVEDLTKNGLVAIIDCRGIGLTHVKVFTPSRIQFLFNIFVVRNNNRFLHTLINSKCIFCSLVIQRKKCTQLYFSC